jgi:MFS family permease
MAGSVNVGMFIAFRFVAGAAAFMILAAVPILMNEIVPVHLRGALVDVHAVMLVLGYTIQGWVGFGFYFWQNGSSNTWRPPIAIQCFWPLCLLIGLVFIPVRQSTTPMNSTHLYVHKLSQDEVDFGFCRSLPDGW